MCTTRQSKQINQPVRPPTSTPFHAEIPNPLTRLRAPGRSLIYFLCRLADSQSQRCRSIRPAGAGTRARGITTPTTPGSRPRWHSRLVARARPVRVASCARGRRSGDGSWFWRSRRGPRWWCRRSNRCSGGDLGRVYAWPDAVVGDGAAGAGRADGTAVGCGVVGVVVF